MKKTKDKTVIVPDAHHKTATRNAIYRRMTKEEYMAIIEESKGLMDFICFRTESSMPQAYRAIDYWNLRPFLAECRKGVVHKAEAILMNKLDSENEYIQLKAVEIVMKSKAAQDMGWGTGNNVNIATQVNVMTEEQKKKEIDGIFGINA